MSPKSDRRDDILKAAFEAFAENGYDKTSMDDIVRRSGTSKGTLYWHFKNKHDLFVATMLMALGDLSSGAQALAEQEDMPAAERLRMLYSEAAGAVLSEKQMLGLMVGAFIQSYQSPEAREVMLDVYRDFITWTSQIIEQGQARGEFGAVDARMAAIALMVGGDGIMFHVLLEPDWDVGQALSTLVALILKGMEKEQSSE